jgi:hypothetical protein
MVVDHKGIDSLFGSFSIACTHLVLAFFILNKFIYCHLNLRFVVILVVISTSFLEVLTRKQVVYNTFVRYFVNTVVY